MHYTQYVMHALMCWLVLLCDLYLIGCDLYSSKYGTPSVSLVYMQLFRNYMICIYILYEIYENYMRYIMCIYIYIYICTTAGTKSKHFFDIQ